MDFTTYWFMFPMSILVAMVAMLCGIAGTALFMPVFLLLFPHLGTEFLLNDPVTAVAASLMTSTFGFTSGFIGYYRKRLMDFSISRNFLILSVPAALVGCWCSYLIEPRVLRLAYGLLLFALAFILIYGFGFLLKPTRQKQMPGIRTITDSTGASYQYAIYAARKIPTLLGGFLTGMLATGMGEVVMPQLLKDGKIPVPVAAATSVVVIIGTMLAASLLHVITLIKIGGTEAVPWNLVCYTIPGVIIGGQIGPWLQGRFSSRSMTIGIAVVFTLIGVAMIWSAYGDL